MLRVWLASLVINVQEHWQLEKLRRVHGRQPENRLERL